MNKFYGIGRISTDLEMRQTNSGKSVVKFNLAINRRGEGTDFIPIEVWGAQAENLVQYQQKGNQLAVDGSVRIDNYIDNEGNNRRYVYILAQNIQFLDKKSPTTKADETPTVSTSDVYEDFGNEISIDDNFLD